MDRGAMGLGGYSSWGCKESDMTEQWSAHTVIRKSPLTGHSNYRQCGKLSSHYFEKVCFLKQKMPINKRRELYIIHLCHKGRSKSLYHRNEMLRMTLTHTAKSVTPFLYNLKSEIFQKKKCLFFSVVDRVPKEDIIVLGSISQCAKTTGELSKHTNVFFQFSQHQFLSRMLCLSIATQCFACGTLEV